MTVKYPLLIPWNLHKYLNLHVCPSSIRHRPVPYGLQSFALHGYCTSLVTWDCGFESCVWILRNQLWIFILVSTWEGFQKSGSLWKSFFLHFKNMLRKHLDFMQYFYIILWKVIFMLYPCTQNDSWLERHEAHYGQF